MLQTDSRLHTKEPRLRQIMCFHDVSYNVIIVFTASCYSLYIQIYSKASVKDRMHFENV